MRYCPNCGNPIPDDARFCGRCGSDLQPLQGGQRTQRSNNNGNHAQGRGQSAARGKAPPARLWTILTSMWATTGLPTSTGACSSPMCLRATPWRRPKTSLYAAHTPPRHHRNWCRKSGRDHGSTAACSSCSQQPLPSCGSAATSSATLTPYPA